jgi:tellurite resistance protein TerC
VEQGMRQSGAFDEEPAGMSGDSGIPAWAWTAFLVSVVVLLTADLLAYRGARAKSRRLTLTWTIVWIAMGLAFGGFVWATLGAQLAQEYLGAYAMEKSLSLDNLFVFLVIFKSLNIPEKYQHKVLFWGILGAVVFRAVLILVGVSALRRWDWITYVFGALLFYAAYRAFREDPGQQHESPVVGWLSRHLPVTEDSESGRFIARKNGSHAATPLLVALLAVEVTDVMFAIDSVPAALAITRNEFIVYCSNIFAILGLRALYLLLAQTITRLRYLHYGLAGVLIFAGIKIIADDWIHIPPLLSVAIIATIIGASVWASVRRDRPERIAEAG